ncbi:Uncharacterised protein [Legionella londiniensis]|uniref:Uncharacterized protein n=2 Tax=Legionella londiniensis TaxID=45068 RepID=A0A0W0VMG4_9GAMM|nr:hypothetical protein [Legionella londiniensis]KTD21246.1 hypothetical protein Llon_1344 [Legionella londiniensis]STX93272.1 Uncharacterised protein [Legionella londiniensis]
MTQEKQEIQETIVELPDQENPIEQAKNSLLGSIGKYDSKTQGVSQLSEEGKKALYDGFDKYQKERQEELNKAKRDNKITEEEAKDPAYYRKKFIEFLYDKAQKKEIKTGNGEPVTLEAMLGQEGVELYQKALKEERYSQEYMDAVFNKATKHYEGEKWAERLIVPIGGPSGAGKSYAAGEIVKQASTYVRKVPNDDSGNYVVSIDGGIGREMSKIRNEVIKVARLNGHAGVSDLHEQSKVLGGIKKNLWNAAMKTKGLSMVWPETFSHWHIPSGKLYPKQIINAIKKRVPLLSKLQSELLSLANMQDTKVIFSRVVSPNNDEQMKNVIRYNGNKRAYGDISALKKGSYEDTDYSKLPESKAYSAGPLDFFFNSGLFGSRDAEKHYQKVCKKPVVIHVVNDMILVKNTGGNNWVRTNDPNDATMSVSERLFNDWQAKEPDTSLEEYVQQHRSEYKPLIKNPELAKLESSVEQLLEDAKRHNDDIAIQIAASLQKQIQQIETCWRNDKKADCRQKIENVKLLLHNCGQCTEYLKLPKANRILNHLSEQLIVMKSSLLGEKEKSTYAQTPSIDWSAKKDFMTADNEDALGFKTEFVDNVAKINEGIDARISETANCTAVQSETAGTVKFKSKELKENEAIRAYLDFGAEDGGNKKIGLLKQDHTGKVTDLSSDNLATDEKARVAFKQAQMFLMQWKPGGGDITIRGPDKDMANKVYASLLLLKESDPKFKQVKIVSLVAGCNGPKKGGQAKFIKQHLGTTDDGPLNKDMRERAVQELREAGSAKFRDRLSEMRQEFEKPPVQSREEQEQQQGLNIQQ